MNNMRKALFFLGMAVFAAAGCRQSSPDAPVEPGLVKIEPVITRATATNFEQGDQIGLAIIKADGTEYADNACLAYDEAAKAFAGDMKWYAQGGDACMLKAFFPYQADGFPTSFTVAADQSDGAGSSDFMAAAKSGVLPQREAVAMVFRHYLSQIVVNIANTADAEIEYVCVRNLVPTADISIGEDGEITVSAAEADASDIKAECMTPNQKYRAIVVPQTSTLSLEIKVMSGTVLVTDIPESILKQGYTYTINAEVTSENVKVALSGEIQNWDDGGELNGEQRREVSFHEYLEDGYIEYDNVNYTVKDFNGKIWMTQPLRYVPYGTVVSSDPQSDDHIWYSVPAFQDGGAESAKNEKYGYLYDYYAIFGTNDITEDNYESFEGAQGICPKGWHIPTKAEGDALVAPAETALFYDSDLMYATIPNANAAGFQYVMSGIRNKTTLSGNGAYLTTAIDAAKAGNLTEYLGENTMNYIALSTGHLCKKNDGVITNYQFFGIMSTFSPVIHGKLNTAFTNICSGYQVRCVRDSE